MNIDQTTQHLFPFKHWEMQICLDDPTLKEIIFASILDGKRSYDGTRAADHTGKGLDGKLRLFIDKRP